MLFDSDDGNPHATFHQLIRLKDSIVGPLNALMYFKVIVATAMTIMALIPDVYGV